MTPKVSLAVITGNAGRYIRRFLDSFQPWVDEVIVVRAIGNQEPDETLDVAGACGCVTAEYHNTRKDWPHVDDFGAARNVAFDLASHEWVMWADLDDILEGGEFIRADLADMPEECEALSVPYDIRDDQVRIFRERVIRMGAARWVNPVHENLDFPNGVKVAETQRWQIVHAPVGHRKANDERNVRLLEAIEKPNGSQRFHLFQSLRAVGRVDDAMRLAAGIIQERPDDVGEAEVFEILLALAQLAEDPQTRKAYCAQAVALCPERREGYGEMAICEMATGRPEKAEAWLEAMESQRLPASPPWNTRRKFHGWLAPHLRGMVLRMTGHPEAADAIETNHFVRSGAKISLLHATRGRHAMAAATRRLWFERAADPDAIEHIFGLDFDDESAMQLTCHRHVWLAGNGGPVEAWNACAEHSRGEVLIQLSDDWDPPLHWDKAILEAIGDTSKEAVLAVSDGGRRDDLLCMAILTRARYRKQGWMFHPEFFSMHSDNWFTHCAKRDRVVIDARDRITIEHLHPVFGKGEMDETYERSNSGHQYCIGEGILRRIRTGVRVSSEIPGWFDFRDVYDRIALTVPDGGKVVEVGCYKGRSAVYLAQRFEDFNRTPDFFLVDTFRGDADTGTGDFYDECRQNLEAADLDHLPRMIREESVDASALFEDGSLDAVFIDAAHDFESVKADLAAWRPKVKPGGILAGHDADSYGVQKALADAHIEAGRVGRCWFTEISHFSHENETGQKPITTR